MKPRNISLLTTMVAGLALSFVVANTRASEKGEFQAGAARIEITPPKDAGIRMSGYGGRDEPFEGVFDKLYYRAVVVDDGTTQAAIVVGDVASIGSAFWKDVSARIEAETGIPRGNVLLAATHTHGGPLLAYHSRRPDANQQAYTDDVADRIVEVVRSAKQEMVPALMGVGTGQANINVNRRARLPDGGYWLGQNPDGPSDKTVHVVKFAAADGRPIALLINYGVHATVLGPKNLRITADVAGATSRYVEERFGDEIVAPWTSGAAGDQAPLYNAQDDLKWCRALGQILGDEVIRVAEGVRMSKRADLRALQTVVVCPGKRAAPGERFRGQGEYHYLDAEPVEIRLSVLMLNHVALCGVSGEVLTMIGQRLKRESPFADTIMVTHCNGSSGYLADDAAYEQVSYEIAVTRVKSGAEDAIVGGLLDLLDQM